MIRSKVKINENKKVNSEKILNYFIFLVLVFGVLVLFFTAKAIFFPKAEVIIEEPIVHNHFGLGGFTEYDLVLAKELMDKDGDGKCDVCGMPVEMCIESGQLQCNMGGKTDKLNIGVLDETKKNHHYHADLKVYLNDKEINLAQEKYFVKSRFMHVENDAQGDSGDVLHMHATGVPLWIFFDSIELELPEATKVYVNGELNSGGLNYVFNDLDKILITGGKGDLQEQSSSITDFAGNH